MRLLRLAIVLVGTLLAPLSALANPVHGVALVVGESSYEHLAKLSNPKRDARDMDDLFDSLGFDVDRVLDGDADDLRAAFARFVEQAKGADVAIVYYSGHGIEAGGRNYLVPVDTASGSADTLGASLVPVDELIAELTASVPVTIVLLDACRTSPFPPNQTLVIGGNSEPVGLANQGLEVIRGTLPRSGVQNSLGIVVGFAAAPGQAALDGEPGENSPYAAALLKHFGASGYSFSDVMTLVTEEVYLKTRARQVPWTNSSLRRVLTFSEEVPASEAPQGEEAEIREGRRRLLLTIRQVPSQTRQYLQTVAAEEGLPLDILFGTLKSLMTSGGKDALQLNDEVLEAARLLKQLMEQPADDPVGDPEIDRLAELARQAESEGALDVALTFRLRAAELATKGSKARREIDKRREEASQHAYRSYAAIHSEAAAAALRTFAFETAANEFGAAFDEVAGFDLQLAQTYKRQQADAFREYGRFNGDNAALVKAIDVYHAAAALPGQSQKEALAIQKGLGIAQWRLGARQSDVNLLEEGISTLRKVIAATFDVESSEQRAFANIELAAALWRLAERQEGSGGYYAAAESYRIALQAITKDTHPYDWARTQNGIGMSLWRIGVRTSSEATLLTAAVALKNSQSVWTPSGYPVEWGLAQINLAGVLGALARHEGDTATAMEAIEVAEAAASKLPRMRYPLYWATAMQNKGSVQLWAGMHDRSRALVEAAVGTLQLALEERTRERSAVDWARTKFELGRGYLWLELDRASGEYLTSAVATLEDSLTVNTLNALPTAWLNNEVQLARALALRAERHPTMGNWDAVIVHYRRILNAPSTLPGWEERAWAADHLSSALLELFSLGGEDSLLDEALRWSDEAQKRYSDGGRDLTAHFDRLRAAIQAARSGAVH